MVGINYSKYKMLKGICISNGYKPIIATSPTQTKLLLDDAFRQVILKLTCAN